MNRELLTKLYSDAVEYCVAQPTNADGTSKAWLWEEKFAELIIQECGNAMIEEDTYYGKWMNATIKEHFGVKQ